jgi:hypothetical protein
MTKDEALRLALEALEYEAQKGSDNAYQSEREAIKAALEAKDEPVLWRNAAIRLGEELSSVGPNGYYDMDAKEWLDWAMEQNPRGEHSLPQRTWVGLTDEERDYIWEKNSTTLGGWDHGGDEVMYDRHFEDAVIAIEAKLKEKNT